MGRLRLSEGKADEAARRFSEVVAFYDAAAALHGDDPKFLDRQAASRLYLAAAHRQQGSARAEADAYAKATEIYRRLVAAQPDATVYRENLGLTQTDYGQLLLELGESREAHRVFVEAKEALAALAASYPSIARFHEEHALATDNLGQAKLALDDAGAAAECQAARKLFQALAETYPDVPQYEQRLAVCRSHCAQALEASGEVAAQTEFAAAVHVLEGLVAEYDAMASFRFDVAVVLTLQGDAFWNAALHDDAAATYDKAATQWRELPSRSKDAAYLDHAAWFFSTCPVDAFRDRKEALQLAQAAAGGAPENLRFRAILALAQLRAGQVDASLHTLSADRAAEFPADVRGMFVASLAFQAAGLSERAARFLERAREWKVRHLPGDWELAQLERECTQALEAEAQSLLSHPNIVN